MARRVISLDEKIRKAEAAVASAKEKYDAALDELEKLVTKRKQLGFLKWIRTFVSMQPLPEKRLGTGNRRL